MKVLLGAIYPYAFLLLFLIIPFDNYIMALPNILLGILVLAFPFVVSKEDFKKLNTATVVFFFSFFIFLIASALLFGRLTTDFVIIKKVFIPVGLLLLYLPVLDAGKLYRAIIFSSLAAIVAVLLNIVMLNNVGEEFRFADYIILIESIQIDRLYLGFLSVLSILVSYHLLNSVYHPNNKYYLANIVVNVLFLVLILSKIAILTLVLILVLRQFYGSNKKIRIIALLGCVGLLSLVYFNVRGDLKQQGFLNENVKTESNYIKKTLTWEIRTVVWHCANLVSQDNGLILKGLGFTETKNQLATCYAENILDSQKREQFVSERFNSHNQFIDFYLSNGLLGLILWVALLVLLFVSVRRNFFATALLLILCSYCFIENIFHRQLGAYFAAFILIILLTKNWRNQQLSDK